MSLWTLVGDALLSSRMTQLPDVRAGVRPRLRYLPGDDAGNSGE